MKPFVPSKLPPTGIDWADLVPAIGRANRALAHYDGVLLGIPHPEVMLAPLTTQEAVLSSAIEGTQVTLGEVLEFEAGAEMAEESRREDVREILNYRRALRHAESALERKPFHLNLLLELHAVLLDSVRGRGRGELRAVQNWIGPPGTPMAKAHFVPPEPGRMRRGLDDWERYYHADERDPLVQLAIVHAQFEILHPFVDGNGRLGRILIPLFLFEKRVLSRPMFYLSAYLEAHRGAYVRGLRALDGGDSWNRWIAFFLGALTEQAEANAPEARAILALYERLKQRVLELTHSQYAVPLLDRLFARPIFAASHLAADDALPSKQMVAQLLRTLRQAGILRPVREARGRRAQVLALAELVNLCEGREVV